ncbi:MAG: hypothetical protein AAB619_04310, partial [Patescibacteria group bacterium]
MATVVDDELDQTTDSAVDDPAAARGERTDKPATAPPDEPNPAIGETDIGVVVTPGRGDEPDIVSGYFVTLGNDGRIVNDTGVATARLLAAARSSGQPIYVKRNGRVYRGRLEPSGHSVVALDPVIPSSDLTRSLHLPANEQHRLMDRHLEAVEAVERLVTPPVTDTAPPAARVSAPPIPPRVSTPPIGPPAASSAGPTAVTPTLPVQPRSEVPPVSPVPPSIPPTVTIPDVGETPPGINAEVPSIDVSADTAGAAPATVLLVPGIQESTPQSPVTLPPPEKGQGITPPPPEDGRGITPLLPEVADAPKPLWRRREGREEEGGPSPTGATPTGVSEPTPATGQPVATPSASPRYGRRPRRATPRGSGPAPATTPVDQAPSPAFAQTGVHPPISPRRVEPIAGGAEPVPSGPPGLPVDQIGQPAQTPSPPPAPPPSHPDHQAYRPSVPAAPLEFESTVEGAPVSSALPVQTPSPEVPAAEAKVPPPTARQPAPADQPRPPETVGGGRLEGVDEEYQPFTAPAPRAPAATPTERAGLSAEESPEFQDAAAREAAGGAEGQTPEMMAQELRSQKLAAQRRAQFEAADRARQRQAIQAGQKAKQIPVQYESEKERLEKIYKRGWQIAQEVAEDQALSMTDLFLFSGPVVVGLYLLRWMGGNMMGNMFTKELTARPPPDSAANQPDTSVSVQLIPGYSISDPIDYVRHMKFMIVAAW